MFFSGSQSGPFVDPTDPSQSRVWKIGPMPTQTYPAPGNNYDFLDEVYYDRSGNVIRDQAGSRAKRATKFVDQVFDDPHTVRISTTFFQPL